MACLSACTSSVGIALSQDRLLWAGDITHCAVNATWLPAKLCTMPLDDAYSQQLHINRCCDVAWNTLAASRQPLLWDNLQHDCVTVTLVVNQVLSWNTLQVELSCGSHCFHLADVHLHHIHAARHIPNHVTDSQLCPCCNWRRTASDCSCLGVVSSILVFWPQN